MRYLLLALLVLASFPAHAAEEKNPLEVEAPPAPTEPVPDWLKYQDPYGANKADVTTAHRSGEEIIAWSQDVTAEAMSFAPDMFNAQLTEVKKKFSPQGWNEYVAWITASQMADMVRTQKYNVTTIVNGDADILNSGTVGGAYRWLVDVPVIITFSQTGADGQEQSFPGGKHRLTLQLGRIATQSDEEAGVMVESWKIVPMGK